MKIKDLYLFFNLNRKIKYTIILLIFLISNAYKIIIKGKNISTYQNYINYINDCRNNKKYNRKSIIKEKPFISICLPTYNMEKYIKKGVMSIINQSFQEFEIIFINDNSNDKTAIILEQLQLSDNRIKIINHNKNLGVYASRVDGIINSKGKFLILMDPDDMLLNPNLLENLYEYYLKYNLDMIEYTVFFYEEKNNYLYIEKKYYHFHHLDKNIIYQPELSDIIVYNSKKKNYTSVRCRPIWNKIIRKEVLLKTINYIGKDYYREFFITAEDTLINVLNFQFALNYSNIDYPGYMYSLRETSMTHGERSKQKMVLFSYNYFLYLKKFFKLIKDFKRDKQIFFYELKATDYFLFQLRKLDKNKEKEVIKFYQEIKEDKNISQNFKEYIIELLK